MREIELIAGHFGLSIVAFELPTSGQGRTALVETVDGAQVVFKWSDDVAWCESLPRAVSMSASPRARGYPAPATIRSGAVPAVGCAWVQERMEGVSAVDGLNSLALVELLDAIELQANADRSTISDVDDEWSWVHEVVYTDHAGWWQSARSQGETVSDFCDQLKDWLTEVERPPIRKDWVIHDLNFSNVLLNDGRLAGVIDLDHVGIGDRSVDISHLAFEYEKLRFRTGFVPVEDAVSLLRSHVLAISGEAGWRLTVAYRAVASLGWVSAKGMRVPTGEALFAAQSLVAAI